MRVNLQYLKELFKKIWAFSIGHDAGNNAGSSYLDIRMHCFFKGDLQNLHLLAIPMRERHTGMSETEGGQTDEVGRRRHREQADDIMTNRRRRGQADNVTDKQTYRRGISTRLRVSTIKKISTAKCR
jgi:hypothetical protein